MVLCEEALKHILWYDYHLFFIFPPHLTYDSHPLVFLRDLEAVCGDLAAVDAAGPEVDLPQPDVRRGARR